MERESLSACEQSFAELEHRIVDRLDEMERKITDWFEASTRRMEIPPSAE